MTQSWFRKAAVNLGLLACLCAAPSLSQAGAYIFAGEGNGVDVVAHPIGYTGTGGTVTLNVCQAVGDGNGPALADWEQSLRNMIATYNQMLPTTGNLRYLAIPGTHYDFESVALHELGHCIGKAHVNAASESSLPGLDKNYTKATDGIDDIFNVATGDDGVIGSADDVRGDDVNLHWFRKANNNPFTIDYSFIDSTTYARDTVDLPVGDDFAANADRTVADDVLAAYSSEAVMQQGSSPAELQRTLVPDDVATLLYARAGLDETQGAGDDYDVALQFATSDCDINLSFDNAQTGFAVCGVGGSFISNSHIRFTSAGAYFNSGFNWFLNSDKPCQQTATLVQDQWSMFSLPCLVGISTGATVTDILGDDLTGTYDVDWAVFERDAVNDSYVQLGLNDEMEVGKGYWLISTQAGQSYDVEGQFSSAPDIFLSGEDGVGRWNMVGHPFDFPVDWADVQIVDGADVIGISSVNETTEMSKTFQVWNGNTYDSYDDATPGMEGTLSGGEGIWLKVFKDGLRLRAPAIAPAGTLTIPTGVGTVGGAGTVTVNWDNVGGGQSYQVRRWDFDGSSCSTSSLIHDWVTSDISQYIDTAPSNPTGHCYNVRACWGTEAYPRMNGCSGWSGLVTGTPTSFSAETSTTALAVDTEALDIATIDASALSEQGTMASEQPVIKLARAPRREARIIADDGSWYVRVIANAEGKEDRGTVLGGLPDSIDTRDSHDLEKREPFGDSYLSVMFPHSEWDDESNGEVWGYASDYRSLTQKPSGTWTFAVYASADVGEVTLSFEGAPEIMRHFKLWQDEARGRADAKKGDSFTFQPEPGLNYFTITVGRR